jgi:predicted amidohydrolase
MRVAAIQLEIDPGSRTETLQRALQALDAAAEMDPAPDLVVLPAFLDTCRDGDGSHFEVARGPGTAACGFRGRTWGLFVAMGMAERAKPLPTLKGVLLDRDADYRLIQPLTRPGAGLARTYQGVDKPLQVANVLIGRIAVLVDDDILSEDAWREVVARRAQLIVGTIGAKSVKAASFESALTRLAKQFERPCIVADLVAKGSSPATRREGVSRIIDADGRVIAAAKAGVNATLTADLALPPIPDSEDAMMTGADHP